MSFLYPTRAINAISSCFGYGEQPEVKPIYEGRNLQVVVADRPLAQGSVRIRVQSMRDDIEKNSKVAYKLIRKVIDVWKEKGIENYMIYRKYTDGKTRFDYEIVPYPSTNWKIIKIWNQFKILLNIAFGPFAISSAQQENVKKDFEKVNWKSSLEAISNIADEAAVRKCIFCKFESKVKEKQLIHTSKQRTNVLADYAPLGPHHFLVMPDEHIEKFSDLSEKQFVETETFTVKLVDEYRKEGFHTAYVLDKTGLVAGQNPSKHLLRHVILVSSKTQAFFGKLGVLKAMLFGYSSPLSPEKLKNRVDAYEETLPDVLKA